eukprot:7303173-Prymnesium_polylepis.1
MTSPAGAAAARIDACRGRECVVWPRTSLPPHSLAREVGVGAVAALELVPEIGVVHVVAAERLARNVVLQAAQ